MSETNIKKRRNGNVIQVARLFERYGIEEGVQRLNKTLERRISERTAQLEAANKELGKEIAERKRMEETLRSLALTDDLTGLYNRRGFLILAEQQFKLAHRMGIGLSLVYADLDGLKLINDTFGHNEGSAALQKTAEILKETFRDSDIIARLGGLGGHLKTGHTWSGQNRPMEYRRDWLVFTPLTPSCPLEFDLAFREALFFLSF